MFLKSFPKKFAKQAKTLDKTKKPCYTENTSSEGVFLFCPFLGKTERHLSNEGGKTLKIYREVL